MNIVIYEAGTCNNFYPLSVTKPLWELRAGFYSFRERMELFINRKFSGKHSFYYFTRDHLAPLHREKYPQLRINDFSVFDMKEECMLISATLLPGEYLLDVQTNSMITCGDVPVCARMDPDMTVRVAWQLQVSKHLEVVMKNSGLSAAGIDISSHWMNYIWDIVHANGRIITDDFHMIETSGITSYGPNVTIVGDPGHLYVGYDVRIDPFVVIDVTKGPVYIGDTSVLNSFTRIEGPCYIGKNCLLLGAKVREGSSIGDFCRIGGEIEDTIVYAYSNKYHDGFIGHSYIGEWVNLGAMTTNSDLKNDYSSVRVFVPDRVIDTKNKKVGCFIGDYVKTGIGSLINTGTSIGPCAMLVFDGKVTPPHIPPFSWFVNSSVRKMDWLEKMIVSAREMMSRRGAAFTETHEAFLRELYTSYT